MSLNGPFRQAISDYKATWNALKSHVPTCILAFGQFQQFNQLEVEKKILFHCCAILEVKGYENICC